MPSGTRPPGARRKPHYAARMDREGGGMSSTHKAIKKAISLLEHVEICVTNDNMPAARNAIDELKKLLEAMDRIRMGVFENHD